MKLDDLKCTILSEILSEDLNEGVFDFLRRRNDTNKEENDFRTSTMRNLGGNLRRSQAKSVDDFLKFAFASGLYDDPDDAKKVVDAVKNNPNDVADVILHTLSQPGTKEYFAKIADASSDRNLATAMRQGYLQLLKTQRDLDREEGGDGNPPPSLEPQDMEADNDPSGAPGADGDDKKSKLPKDLPLSITKRQKETQPGEGKPLETPLNSYLQKKLGLTPQSANQITKNIGSYLKSRGIPIAESKFVDLLEQRLVHKKADFDKVRAEIENLDKKLAAGNLTPQQKQFMQRSKVAAQEKIKRMEKDVESQKGTIKGRKEGERAAFQARKKEIEAQAKKHGVVGNIIFKYLARQGQKDQEFAKMFEKDPKALDKVAKSVRNMLRRQLKRRGYDGDGPEMKKLQLEILQKLS